MFKKIKQQLKRFKSWIILVVLGIGVCFAAGQSPNDTFNIVLEEMSIVEQLQNKTAIEKAEIKSRELAKVKIGNFLKNDLEIEIIGDIKAIEINGSHGIEFFAKAWKNNKQLGFGKDGSVEIERFRIFNPPILIDDENGDIIREWIDEITGEIKQRKLKENPEEAIKQSLAHTIGLVGKENTKIIKGKIGNTTSTFYSVAGANSPVDGNIVNDQRVSWDAIHDATSANNQDGLGGAFPSSAAGGGWGPAAGAYRYDTNGRKILARSFFLFDTSPIGDSDTINSADFSFYINSKADNSGQSPTYNIVQTTPANNNNLVVGDFDQCGAIDNPDTGATAIAHTSITTSAYNAFTLNATGLGWISKTSITKIGLRVSQDITDTELTAGNDKESRINGYFADQTGTANDPKLVVVHEAAAAERRIIIIQ